MFTCVVRITAISFPFQYFSQKWMSTENLQCETEMIKRINNLAPKTVIYGFLRWLRMGRVPKCTWSQNACCHRHCYRHPLRVEIFFVAPSKHSRFSNSCLADPPKNKNKEHAKHHQRFNIHTQHPVINKSLNKNDGNILEPSRSHFALLYDAS